MGDKKVLVIGNPTILAAAAVAAMDAAKLDTERQAMVARPREEELPPSFYGNRKQRRAAMSRKKRAQP